MPFPRLSSAEAGKFFSAAIPAVPCRRIGAENDRRSRLSTGACPRSRRLLMNALNKSPVQFMGMAGERGDKILPFGLGMCSPNPAAAVRRERDIAERQLCCPEGLVIEGRRGAEACGGKKEGHPFGCPLRLEERRVKRYFEISKRYRRTTQPAVWPAPHLRRTGVFARGENLGRRAALPP